MLNRFADDSLIFRQLIAAWNRRNANLTALVGVGTLCLTYYVFKIARRPNLFCNEKMQKFLLGHCPALHRRFWPTFWCYGGRVQTILRSLLQSTPFVDYVRETLDTSDGGQLVLFWLNNHASKRCPDDSTRPTVLLLPGLTGSGEASYVLHYVKYVESLGYRAVVFNNRGTGGCSLKTSRTYCATSIDDLRFVVTHIKDRYPDAPLMAAGISLGGNEDVFRDSVNLETVYKCKTILQFDRCFTSVLFGYPDNDAYYTDASIYRKIDNVKVPILCLNAADDPFSPGYAVPVKMAEKSDSVAIVLTNHGGHIGFLEGLLPRHTSYMDQLFGEFAEAVFTNMEELQTL